MIQTRYLASILIVISLTVIGVKKGWMCGCSDDEQIPNSRLQAITEYREVKSIINSCRGPKVLVTFDVDNTLIAGTDALARISDNGPSWFKLCLSFKYFPELLNTEKREKLIDEFLGTLFAQAPRCVFDNDVIGLIKQLQDQKCITIGLTAMGSGSVGPIASLPEWRRAMLVSFKIDFGNTFKDVTFTSFPMKHHNYPCLYHNILCTNYEAKGPVLGAFLTYYNLTPDLIISFDDQEDMLISIRNECTKRNIKFIGYQVLGANKIPGEWNTSRALLQFDNAIENHKWLTDNEADAILAGKSNIKVA